MLKSDQVSGNKSSQPNRSDIKPTGTSDKVEIKCFNCGNYGHISKYCQQEKRRKRIIKCYRCGEEGHTPKYCSKPKSMSVSKLEDMKLIENEENQDITREKNPITKYIKRVTLDEIDYTAMIDPGSSECTIKASAALQGSFDIQRNQGEL